MWLPIPGSFTAVTCGVYGPGFIHKALHSMACSTSSLPAALPRVSAALLPARCEGDCNAATAQHWYWVISLGTQPIYPIILKHSMRAVSEGEIP